MLDYPALAALAAVIREGSFERAALALHVTPSAVSQRIRLLEERVGCALVVREQPCRATDTGRRLCQHVDRVRLLEQELQGTLPALAPQGQTRVALPIAVNADSLATDVDQQQAEERQPVVPGRVREELERRRRRGAARQHDLPRLARTADARGLGGGTEFEQLREYGPDDEFRRIDWTATARAGKPIVRTYRAERNQSVIVVLDNGRIMAGQVDGVPRVEHAMDAAMMLTSVSTRLGDRCGLVAFDRRVRAVVPPGRHSDQVGRVSEALYRLEPELAESDYTGAFAEVVARVLADLKYRLVKKLDEEALEMASDPYGSEYSATHAEEAASAVVDMHLPEERLRIGDLLRVFQRLEARGEIRGGRFVAGLSGEQFALPGRLRCCARCATRSTTATSSA